MDVADFVSAHPRVFHTASATAWPSIQQHGLLSTVGLLDLFGVNPDVRNELLTRPRKVTTELSRHGHPPAVIRDQKPMKFLKEKLEPGHTIEEFLTAINSRVFFWPSRERLDRLRNARSYRNEEQVILHIDCQELVARYQQRIELCRFNSGAITQMNHPARSRDSWQPLSAYPYQEYRRRYGRDGALAEVTVLGSIPDILELVKDVQFSSNRP